MPPFTSSPLAVSAADFDRLPNFFIPGAAKSGTTSLFAYLCQHPAIYLPKEKEPGYFSQPDEWLEGIDWYLSRFYGEAAAYPCRGDASTAYMIRSERVLPRLQQLYGPRLSTLRVIMVYREPAARAWSHYQNVLWLAKEPRSFAQAIHDDMAGQGPEGWYRYYRDGCYATILEQWLEYFRPDQFLHLLTDDMQRDALGTMHRVFDFLGVDTQVPLVVDKAYNRAQTSLSPWLMKLLNHPPAIFGPLARWLMRA